MIERLESRLHLTAAGPMLSSIEFFGTPKAVSSVVLGFNEPLNPATTANLTAYAFGKGPLPYTPSDGFPWESFLGFRYINQRESAVAKPKLVKLGKIQMASAVYDAASDTVTLTPLAPFKAQTYLRFLRVQGTGDNAIEDTSGNLLNGGSNTIIEWNMHQGKTIHYQDSSHDHVTLKLTGPGKLMVFTLKDINTDAIIFVENATAATTLSGIVTNTTKILPTVEIGEIEGAGAITDNLTTNPEFDVLTTTP